MVPFLLFILVLTTIEAKPNESSTHDLLEKLGFEKYNKPQVNHHKKRVASETNKARYTIDDYNRETDSHMFLVKLPPHPPYYTPSVAQNIDKTVTKPPIHFRTNGKPSKVYHWNIPILKKIAENKYRAQSKNQITDSKNQGDSKIYNLKIHGDKEHYYLSNSNEVMKPQKHKKRTDISMKNLRKHEENQDYLMNVLNDMQAQESKRRRKDDGHIMTIKELAENEYKHIKDEKHKKHENEVLDTEITNILMEHKKKYSEKKKKHKETPSIYHPAIPKQNSFYKYFPGNGKPKSFYVIEKNKNPSRYHRLL